MTVQTRECEGCGEIGVHGGGARMLGGHHCLECLRSIIEHAHLHVGECWECPACCRARDVDVQRYESLREAGEYRLAEQTGVPTRVGLLSAACRRGDGALEVTCSECDARYALAPDDIDVEDLIAGVKVERNAEGCAYGLIRRGTRH